MLWVFFIVSLIGFFMSDGGGDDYNEYQGFSD